MAQGPSVEVTGLRNVSHMADELQVGVDGHTKRTELCDQQSAAGDVDSSDVGS